MTPPAHRICIWVGLPLLKDTAKLHISCLFSDDQSIEWGRGRASKSMGAREHRSQKKITDGRKNRRTLKRKSTEKGRGSSKCRLILILNMAKTYELPGALPPGPPLRAWPVDRGFATSHLKGPWTSVTSSKTSSKKVGIFIPLQVFAWVKTACWVLCSRMIYFWRNVNISSIFFLIFQSWLQ